MKIRVTTVSEKRGVPRWKLASTYRKKTTQRLDNRMSFHCFRISGEVRTEITEFTAKLNRLRTTMKQTFSRERSQITSDALKSVSSKIMGLRY